MKTLVETSAIVDKSILEQQVKSMYENVATNPEAGYHFKLGKELALQLGYDHRLLSKIPSPSIASFAGVGHHFDLAKLQPGESVADLGSGAGMDAFYAALAVGETGKVTGVDMTDGQLSKSKKLKASGGFSQINFVKGYIEELPIATASIDVVITNGVINLSGEKDRVFSEISRILKPNGRLALSDIVASKSFPENITCNPTLWAACVAGAMRFDLYKELIKSCGMKIETEKQNPYTFISDKAKGATTNYGIKSISLLATKR